MKFHSHIGVHPEEKVEWNRVKKFLVPIKKTSQAVLLPSIPTTLK